MNVGGVKCSAAILLHVARGIYLRHGWRASSSTSIVFKYSVAGTRTFETRGPAPFMFQDWVEGVSVAI